MGILHLLRTITVWQMIHQCHLSGRSWQESYRQGSHSSPRLPSLGSHVLVSMTTCKPLAMLATSMWEMSTREWLWKLAFDTPPSRQSSPFRGGGVQNSPNPSHKHRGRCIASINIPLWLSRCQFYCAWAIRFSTLTSQLHCLHSNGKEKRRSNTANRHKIGWK